MKSLQKEMAAASEAMEFEKAAELRDKIRAIQSVQQRQNIVSKEGDYDVVGMARDGEHTGLEVFYIRYGRMVGKENFNISDSAGETDAAILSGFIKDYYGADGAGAPKEILVPELPDDAPLLTEWLSRKRGGEVRLYVPERGFRRRLKDMAKANAEKYLSDKKLQWEYRDAREQGLSARCRRRSICRGCRSAWNASIFPTIKGRKRPAPWWSFRAAGRRRANIENSSSVRHRGRRMISSPWRR